MKKRYLIVMFMITIFVLFLFSTTSYAGTQKLKELDYDVKLNSDGSAEITELWKIDISDTNTLFKTFDINKTKYGSITNVTVEEIKNNGEITQFTKTSSYAYHVQKGSYYALETKADREFEIAWGVSVGSKETKIYRIKYKIINAIKKYEDCSEFYWQFVGDTNGIPVKKVLGKIQLENKVSNLDNLRVWAHGPLNGTIQIIDNNTIEFKIDNLKVETMIEVRIVALENVFSNNQNIVPSYEFDKILKEEARWANETNMERKRVIQVYIGIAIIGIIISTFYIILIIKYARELKKVNKEKKLNNSNQRIDYFRDFPDETATAAEAAFLYYFEREGRFSRNLSKIISATILNLALKKVISFVQTGNEDIYIIMKENANIDNLKTDERKIYLLLNSIKDYNKSKSDSQEEKRISMKDIEKYASKNDIKFLGDIGEIKGIVEKSEEKKGNYDYKLLQISKKWKHKADAYYIISICLIFMIKLIIPLFIVVPGFICAYLCNKISKQTRILTEKGTEEQEKWRALKRYMEEFSLLNEREVPELALWEKYLVYATAFGVADKVIEQLKVRYPELSSENYIMEGSYTYIYMINRINLTSKINTGIDRAYKSGIKVREARNYSSSGGHGGGFSRGGRWRSEVVGRMGGR